MNTMLTGVEGAVAYLDDIIVISQSKQDLTEQTNKVLTRIQDFGFQLQPEKCNFYLQANKYLEIPFQPLWSLSRSNYYGSYSTHATPITHKQFIG